MDALSLKQLGLASVLAVAGSFSVTQNADAAAYLKIGDIKGEATFEPGSISIESWSWASSNDGQKSAPCLTNFNFVKTWDSTSDDLIQALGEGRLFRDAILIVTAPDSSSGQETTLAEFTFTNVKIRNYNVGGASDGRPQESFQFSYSGVEGDNEVGGTAGFFDVAGARCSK